MVLYFIDDLMTNCIGSAQFLDLLKIGALLDPVVMGAACDAESMRLLMVATVFVTTVAFALISGSFLFRCPEFVFLVVWVPRF
jgi:hypothetical protein